MNRLPSVSFGCQSHSAIIFSRLINADRPTVLGPGCLQPAIRSISLPATQPLGKLCGIAGTFRFCMRFCHPLYRFLTYSCICMLFTNMLYGQSLLFSKLNASHGLSDNNARTL